MLNEMFEINDMDNLPDIDTIKGWCRYKLSKNDSLPDELEQLHKIALYARQELMKDWIDDTTIIVDSAICEMFKMNKLKRVNSKEEQSHDYLLHIRYTHNQKKDTEKFTFSLHVVMRDTYNGTNATMTDTFYSPDKFFSKWGFARKKVSSDLFNLLIAINVYNNNKNSRYSHVELVKTKITKKGKSTKVTKETTKDTELEDRLTKLENKVDKSVDSMSKLTNILTKLYDEK